MNRMICGADLAADLRAVFVDRVHHVLGLARALGGHFLLQLLRLHLHGELRLLDVGAEGVGHGHDVRRPVAVPGQQHERGPAEHGRGGHGDERPVGDAAAGPAGLTGGAVPGRGATPRAAGFLVRGCAGRVVVVDGTPEPARAGRGACADPGPGLP